MVGGLTFFSRGDLKDNIVSWAAETNLDDEDVTRSIALCEADMRRRLRLLSSEITTDFVISDQEVVVPARFLAVRVLYIPNSKPMEYASPDRLARIEAEQRGGEPNFYTLVGREDQLPVIRFAPGPDSTYTARLTYNADLGLIDDDDCNDVLSQYGDLYFYGSLTHLAMFLRNDDRLPRVQSYYETKIQEMIRADITDKVSGSALRPRPPQRPR